MRSRARWWTLLGTSYALGVAGFYAAVAWRTRNGNQPAILIKPNAGNTGAGSAPSVTVIVPARNEERNIRDCVESLLAQDYANYRVIVVDDASSDATPD